MSFASSTETCTTQVKKELIKGLSKEKSVVGLSKAKSRSQLVIKKEPKKTLVKTRSRAVLKDKNDPVSVITDDALDVRNNRKKGEKEVQVTKEYDWPVMQKKTNAEKYMFFSHDPHYKHHVSGC